MFGLSRGGSSVTGSPATGSCIICSSATGGSSKKVPSSRDRRRAKLIKLDGRDFGVAVGIVETEGDDLDVGENTAMILSITLPTFSAPGGSDLMDLLFSLFSVAALSNLFRSFFSSFFALLCCFLPSFLRSLGSGESLSPGLLPGS